MFCKKPSKKVVKQWPKSNINKKYKESQELFMYDIDVTSKKDKDNQPLQKMHGEKELVTKLDQRLKGLQKPNNNKTPYEEK
jgi:disulfide oxidoreductase YuzD